MVSASTQNRTAGKDFETQSSRLFVSLESRIDGALKFAQKIKTKEHGQQSRLCGKEGTQAEMVAASSFLSSSIRHSTTARPL
jgi:hypothetical protein